MTDRVAHLEAVLREIADAGRDVSLEIRGRDGNPNYVAATRFSRALRAGRAALAKEGP